MKLALDTNVVMDVFAERAPHHVEGNSLFAALENGLFEGLVCATTVTTIHYLSEKLQSRDVALSQVRRLIGLFQIAPVNGPVLSEAVNLGFSDFEDAVICQSAVAAGADGIITRDLRGFRKSPIPVYSPSDALMLIREKGRRD